MRKRFQAGICACGDPVGRPQQAVSLRGRPPFAPRLGGFVGGRGRSPLRFAAQGYTCSACASWRCRVLFGRGRRTGRFRTIGYGKDLAETIIVVGHKNPDNDAICAAVGYAYLKNQLARKAAGAGEPEAVYKPVRLGPLPPETAWVLQSQGVEEPELIERVEPGQKVVLVDHNELLQAVDGIEEADIVEVVDHHRIGGLSTANPIQFINLPIGSSSTVASLLYRYGGYELPANIAAVMLSSLMTDTVLLKSPTTTQIDRDQAEWLAGIAGVEALEFGRQVIKSRGSGADLPVEKLVAADAKEFQVGDDVVFIAQRETVDSAAVMEREDEMRAYMKQVVADNGYRSFLLLVTDIIEEGSRFICEGDCSLIDKAFGIEVDVPGGVWMPGVLSRKKQAAPPILALA